MEKIVMSREVWLELINVSAFGFARKKIVENDVLIGPGAAIDSLDLLGFLIQLERGLLKKTGVFVPIVSEERLTQILSEGKTVGGLLDTLMGFYESQT